MLATARSSRQMLPNGVHMSEADSNYYRRRAAEERMAMHRATNPVAASAHRVLADRYAALVEEVGLAESAQSTSVAGV